MKNYTYSLLLGFQLIISGCAITVYSSKDESINFYNYKTFAWNAKQHTIQNPDFDNQIIESNVKNYASAELKKRGMLTDIDSADIILDYEIIIKDKTYQESEPIYGQKTQAVRQVNPNNFYNHPYNYNTNISYVTTPYVMGYKNIDVPYEEGTLAIMVIDRKKNRLIWKGVAVGTVTDPQSYEYELHSDIKRMFKEFPRKVIKY